MKTIDYVNKILELNREWLPYGQIDENLIANFGFGLAEEYFELRDAKTDVDAYEEFGDCLAYFVLLSHVIRESNENIASAITVAYFSSIDDIIDYKWTESFAKYFGNFKRFLREREKIKTENVNEILWYICEYFVCELGCYSDPVDYERSLQHALETNVNKLTERKQRNGNFNGKGDR